MTSPDLPTAEQREASEGEASQAPAEPPEPPVRRALRQLEETITRLTEPKERRVRGGLRTIAALAATVGIFAILVSLLGSNPGTAVDAIYTGSVGSFFNLGQTIMIASLLVCTGLAAAIPFRAHLWNVGGEGQMWFGAFCTMGAAFGLSHSTPRPLFILVCLLTA